MERKQTLFDYVYQNLREQITTGRLKYGAAIPSMSRLCEYYNVGIRTVKDVLRTLKEEGYIQTEERKAAVVVYRAPELDQSSCAIRSVLERKSSILGVYQTIEIILPRLFSFSVQLCDDECLSRWALELARAKKKGLDHRWKTCTALAYELLDRSNNHLFRDLFVSLAIYARTPTFINNERFLELIKRNNKFNHAIWVMESLLTKDSKEIETRFFLLFHSITIAVEQFLDEISQEFGDVPENPSFQYSWSVERGKVHYYTQISRDLIDKIGTGQYHAGEFLPSEAELAHQYGVCVTTIRSALAVLNELGFGRTQNAKGTRVILQDEKTTLRCMKNKTYQKDTLMYLSSAQLMAILIRPAAQMAFQRIDSQAIQALKETCSDTAAVPLKYILQCVIDHQPLQPLQLILQEISKLLLWGYYFTFYSDGPSSAILLNQLSRFALNSLCKGDQVCFANYLSECYCHILNFVRGFIVKHGLPDAEKIITPHF